MPPCLQNIVASVAAHAGSLRRLQSSKTAATGQPWSAACLKPVQLAAGQVDSETEMARAKSSGCATDRMLPALSFSVLWVTKSYSDYLKHPHIFTSTLEKTMSFLYTGTYMSPPQPPIKQAMKLFPTSACSFKCGPMGAPLRTANIIPVLQMEP